MNKNKRLITLLLVGILFAFQSFAYDFSVKSGGQSLFFSIIDSVARKVTLVSPAEVGNVSDTVASYFHSSAVKIPSSVIDPSTKIKYSVTAIGPYAFAFSDSLVSVTLPVTISAIDSAAFLHCSALTAVSIPDAVTSISSRAFYGCTALKTVTFGKSLASVASRSFASCSDLSSIVFRSALPPSVAPNAFDFVPRYMAVFVPKSSLSAYKTAYPFFTNVVSK
jgi:hypothetical protein